jgi:hypothetical protein
MSGQATDGVEPYSASASQEVIPGLFDNDVGELLNMGGHFDALRLGGLWGQADIAQPWQIGRS